MWDDLNKLIANHAMVDFEKMINNQLSDDELDRVVEAIESIKEKIHQY